MTASLQSFARQLPAAFRTLLLLTLLLGVAYPLVVLGVGQLVDRGAANGSLVERDGQVVASTSLGQKVTDPHWFQGRRSASDDAGSSSGGSNLGATDPEQVQALADARTALVAANPGASGPPPADALTASGSGLDPDISPAYAQWQVPRVAAARGLTVAAMQALVDEHTKGRLLGFLGEPRVNVTELNLALASTTTP